MVTFCLSLILVTIAVPRLNTNYAPGYSTMAFLTIQVGDSEAKVLDVLGEPLDRQPDFNHASRVYWRYTTPIGPSEHYLLRNIVIEDGRVFTVYYVVWWD